MSAAPVLRPRVYFDVAINDSKIGRVVMELFSDMCPRTCENFRVLCTGGYKKPDQSHPAYYKETTFHRVIKDFMIQGGDIENCDGKGGYSIYGDCFEDENFQLKHDKPFLLSMANKGPDTNASQFFITTNIAPHLDDVHVVFGHVIKGKEVIMMIENQEVDPEDFRPRANIKIVNSGELIKVSAALNLAKNQKLSQPQPTSDREISSGSSASEDESDDNDGENRRDGSIIKELTAAEKANLTEQIYKDKLRLIAKKMNVPIEAMGLLPLDINEIPKIPKNPLQRDVSYHRNHKFYSDSGCTVKHNGRIIKGRGKMDYKPEDKQIQIKHKLESSQLKNPKSADSLQRNLKSPPAEKHKGHRRTPKSPLGKNHRKSSSSDSPRRRIRRNKSPTDADSPRRFARRTSSPSYTRPTKTRRRRPSIEDSPRKQRSQDNPTYS